MTYLLLKFGMQKRGGVLQFVNGSGGRGAPREPVKTNKTCASLKEAQGNVKDPDRPVLKAWKRRSRP
jgi:hypothetical protein